MVDMSNVIINSVSVCMSDSVAAVLLRILICFNVHSSITQAWLICLL